MTQQLARLVVDPDCNVDPRSFSGILARATVMRATRNGVSPTTNYVTGEIQTMSHIVNSCPLTKFDGGLLGFHESDEAAVDWLTTYGS